ncbi:hypothetical protein L210DRAFT_2088207 [Boletus edulis BED1]|uniref:FAD-binding domain-containing protein n=1 Tax=Boletus edulis BED1 TaxID=1328754 RepID=A0AAD4BWD9_BOLED|nr:hypothetical protein L210DRAFT_2088207 [Boletus edulis BED1]
MSSSNSSVQDAFNLAWKLALVHRGLSPATLLDAYTTERLPVIAEMLHLTTGSFHKLRSAPTIEGAMRHERQMNMLGVNYRSSPIVLDARKPSLGMRMGYWRKGC